MLVRDRTCAWGHREDQGTFGVTDGMAVLWGHHRRRMAQGWLCWDGSEPALALGCSPRCRLSLGFCGAFGGSGKSKLPFLGRLDQGGSLVRLSRGCRYPGTQMLDLTTGRRTVASKYPPATQPSVPVTYILVREIILIFMQTLPGHACCYREALGRPQSKAVGAARVCPPMARGVTQRDGTRARVRVTSGADGDPSRWPLYQYGNVSFNTFTLGASIHPRAIKVFACVAAGTSRGGLCGDGFIYPQARHTHTGLLDICV